MRMVSEKSLKNLELGREKGTNHLNGIPKTKQHRENMSRIMTEWCRNNPDKVRARSLKIRGDNHYLWDGGINKLNQAIRQLNENRNWQRKIRKLYGYCSECGATENLECHHHKTIKELMTEYNITSTQEARDCKEMWDTNNGTLLCLKCHYKLHGRNYAD